MPLISPFSLSGNKAPSSQKLTCFSLQNGKAEVPTILGTRISRHNSKWRRRVGPVPRWASQRRSFCSPQPALPRRRRPSSRRAFSRNRPRLANRPGGPRAAQASSLPVVGSRFLSLLGNNGGDNGCLSNVSRAGAGLEAGLHQRLIGGGLESGDKGGAQEARRRRPYRPSRIPTTKTE